MPLNAFTFSVNGTPYLTNLNEAIWLAPTAREQLSIDACARTFVISNTRVAPTDFASRHMLLMAIGLLLITLASNLFSLFVNFFQIRFSKTFPANVSSFPDREHSSEALLSFSEFPPQVDFDLLEISSSIGRRS
jgi:hypothetical protein